MTGVRSFALAAAATVAVSLTLPGTATATPPRDADGTVIWQMTDGAAPNGTDYVFREITVAPGGSTGWHSHPGQLFGVVKEGVLMHNRADCSMDGLYVAGQSVAEKAGPTTCTSAATSARGRWFCRSCTSIPPGRRCPSTSPTRVAGLPDAGNGHPPVCWL